VIVTHGSQPVNASIEIPLIQRPLIVLDSLAFYIEKLLVPWPIGIDYGRTPHRVLASSSVRFEWLLPLALAVGSYLCRKRAPWLPLAAVIMFVGLSPMLGFAPFIFQYISTVADRYVYLAMLGPAIAVAMVFAGGRQPVKWLVAAFAGTCAALSVAHVGVWSNTYALVTSAIAVNPQSSGAHMDLGVIYSDRHLNDKAEAEFATAVRLRPDYSMAHYNLGNAFKDRGAYSQAISEYVTAIKLEPQRAVFYLNLATALYDSGHSQEALPIVDHAKHLDPHLAQVDYLRGNVLMQLGRNEEAISAFQEEITRNPAFAPSYVNAGIVLVAMRRLPDAEAMMRRAVQIGPGSASRYANLAYIQLQLGHVSDARQSLQTALRIDANDQTALAVAAAMRLAH
jgi:tetratricopeptide (TPR) repeat protein